MAYGVYCLTNATAGQVLTHRKSTWAAGVGDCEAQVWLSSTESQSVGKKFETCHGEIELSSGYMRRTNCILPVTGYWPGRVRGGISDRCIVLVFTPDERRRLYKHQRCLPTGGHQSCLFFL